MRRPHRLLGRLVTVVLLDAGALLLLSAILSGFHADSFGAALILAALLALANALIWPLLIRVALPFTVMTLGLGALALNALVLLAVAQIDYGVHVDDFWTALIITLALTAVSSIAAAVLALDSGDLWTRHVVVRQLKRTQLAVSSETPGVLFLEIDGLAHEVLRRALRDGNAPTLARWVHDDGYRLERWETDWSSQTGACQAGILHGSNHDMPAFRWWEKEHGKPIVTNHPRDAAELERRHSDGKGLLHGDGARRANILSGDAPHSMLTMSTVLDRGRPVRLGQDYFAYFASPYGVALTVLRSFGEVVAERWAAIEQRRRDVQPRIKRGCSYAFVRAYRDRRSSSTCRSRPSPPTCSPGGRSSTRRSSPTTRSRTTRARAPRHAGGAAARRPRDRADRRRRRARAAAVPARRALRPRPVAGRDVPAALRRDARAARAAPRRARAGARRGRRRRRRGAAARRRASPSWRRARR